MTTPGGAAEVQAKLLQIVEGTNQIQRVLIARELLGAQAKPAEPSKV